MNKMQKIKLFESLLKENTTTPFLDALMINKKVSACDFFSYNGTIE